MEYPDGGKFWKGATPPSSDAMGSGRKASIMGRIKQGMGKAMGKIKGMGSRAAAVKARL